MVGCVDGGYRLVTLHWGRMQETSLRGTNNNDEKVEAMTTMIMTMS
jgi:hypothetical protein